MKGTKREPRRNQPSATLEVEANRRHTIMIKARGKTNPHQPTQKPPQTHNTKEERKKQQENQETEERGGGKIELEGGDGWVLG